MPHKQVITYRAFLFIVLSGKVVRQLSSDMTFLPHLGWLLKWLVASARISSRFSNRCDKWSMQSRMFSDGFQIADFLTGFSNYFNE